MKKFRRFEKMAGAVGGMVETAKKALSVSDEMDPGRRAVTKALVAFGLAPEVAMPAAGDILQAAAVAARGLPPEQAAAAAIELAFGKVQKAVKLYKLFHTGEIYGPRVDMFYNVFESSGNVGGGKPYLQFIIDRLEQTPDTDSLWTLADIDFAKLPSDITVADLRDPIIMQTVLRREFGAGDTKEVLMPSKETLSRRADHINAVLGLTDDSPLSAAEGALKRKKMDLFRTLMRSHAATEFKGNSLQHLKRLYQEEFADEADQLLLENLQSEQSSRESKGQEEQKERDATEKREQELSQERRRVESLERDARIECLVETRTLSGVLHENDGSPGPKSFLLRIKDPAATKRLQSGRLTLAHLVALRNELAHAAHGNATFDSDIDVDGQDRYTLVTTNDAWLNDALSQAVELKGTVSVPRLPMDYEENRIKTQIS